MQQREGDHHPQRRRERQQQHRHGVPQQADGDQQPRAGAVAQPAAAHLSDDHHHRQQRDQRGRLRARVVERLADVRDEVHHHRRDDEQRGGVGERDRPEGAAAERLPRRRADLDGRSGGGRGARAAAGRRGGGGRGVAVGAQAVVLGPVAHELGGGQADDEHDRGRDERGAAPADLLDQKRDHGRREAAAGHPDQRDADGQRAPPHEPVDDGGRDREEAGQRRADRHQQEGHVEGQQRVHRAERDEAEREQHDADAHHRARPEAVDHPALHRAEQAVLDARERERDREPRAVPAELLLELDDVDAEGVEQQRADRRLHREARGDDPPPVKDVARRRQSHPVVLRSVRGVRGCAEG